MFSDTLHFRNNSSVYNGQYWGYYFRNVPQYSNYIVYYSYSQKKVTCYILFVTFKVVTSNLLVTFGRYKLQSKSSLLKYKFPAYNYKCSYNDTSEIQV